MALKTKDGSSVDSPIPVLTKGRKIIFKKRFAYASPLNNINEYYRPWEAIIEMSLLIDWVQKPTTVHLLFHTAPMLQGVAHSPCCISALSTELSPATCHVLSAVVEN